MLHASQRCSANLVRVYAWILSECRPETQHEVSEHGIETVREKLLQDGKKLSGSSFFAVLTALLPDEFVRAPQQQQGDDNIKNQIIFIVVFPAQASGKRPDQIAGISEKGKIKGKKNQDRNTGFIGKHISADGRKSVKDHLYIDKLQQKSIGIGRHFLLLRSFGHRLSADRLDGKIEDIGSTHVF